MTDDRDTTQGSVADARATDDMVELPAADVSSYELGGELGRGGMGKVLAARDRRLQRMLAIKISKSSDRGAIVRFAREALLTARLQHPSIVPIHEAGRLPTGEPFYAMKLVAGRSLESLIGKTRTLDERLALLPNVIAVVDALAYAHAQRVIHRDLKPGNVIVGEFGETIVIDWGLAKELGSPDDDAPAYRERFAPGMTVEGVAMGTPSYMAPEQAAGEPVDERADVYGLGALLYHVLCGHPPYDGDTPEEVLAQVLVGPPRDLAERQLGVPRDLIAIVDKAMAGEAQHRYANAGALAEDLKRFYRGQLVAAHAYTPWELARRWLRRHRAVISVVAIATVVLLAVGLVAVSRVTRASAIAGLRDRDAKRARAADLENLGRQELLADHPVRAARDLADAYALGRESPALRVLLGDALQRLEAQVLRLDTGGELRAIAFGTDGSLLEVDEAHGARIWDLATAHVTHELGPATDAVMSADGSVIAVADGHAIHVWSGGREVATLSAEHHSPTRVRLAPDGAHLASTGDNGTCVFDLATRAARWCVPDDAYLFAPAFDGDGKRLATRGPAGVITVHDVATGAILATVDAHYANAAVFVPAGGFVTAGTKGYVVRWSADGHLERVLRGSGGDALELAITADGTRIVARFLEETDAWLYRTDADPVPMRGATQHIDGMTLGARGTLIATGGNDGGVRIWDARSGAKLAMLQASVDARALAFSRDGSLLAAGSDDGSIRIWRLAALHLPAIRATAMDHAAARSLSPDGTRVAVAEHDRVAVYDTETRQLRATLATEAVTATFSSDGARIVTLTERGPAQVWDAVTGARLFALAGAHGPIMRAGFTARGEWTVDYGGWAHLWNTRGESLAELPDRHVMRELHLSDDGTRLLLITGVDRITTYDTSDGHVAADLHLGHGAAVSATTNRDGSRVLVVYGRAIPQGIPLARPGSVELWDATARTMLRTLGAATTLASFARDDDSIITGHADGTARIWDHDGTERAILSGHGRELTSVALSSDHALAVTAAADGTVRMWDALSGQAIATHEVGGDGVTAALGDDDRHVVAVTGDGATWSWSLPIERRTPWVITALVGALVTRDETPVSSGVTPATR